MEPEAVERAWSTVVDPVEGRRTGAGTLFQHIYVGQARKLGLLGLTRVQMAHFFQVSVSALIGWCERYPDFGDAVNTSKALPDSEVANSLYQRALGAEWTDEHAVKLRDGDGNERVEVVILHRAAPPDVKAAQFWLTNRQPELWSNRREVAVSGPDGGPIQTQAVDGARGPTFAELLAALGKLTDAELVEQHQRLISGQQLALPGPAAVDAAVKGDGT